MGAIDLRHACHPNAPRHPAKAIRWPRPVSKSHTMPTRTLPSLNALRSFEAAARMESASKAAAELHVTHGAISRQIRALEADLGLALFRRVGRGLVLTAAGIRLRDDTAKALDQLRASCEVLRRQSDAAPLVLGCSGSILARWVIPRLERLARELPDVSLHFSATSDLQASDLPGLDAVLLLGEPPWPQAWQVQRLAEERIGPVLSPKLPNAGELRHANARRLCHEALLHTRSRPQAWPTWARAQRIAPSRLRYGSAFEHLYYLLEAALNGLGVAIAPQPLVADDIAHGRLLAPCGFSATGGSWALCTTQRKMPPRLVQLGEWLRHELAQA